MFAIDRGATKLEDAAAEWLIGSEVKLLLRIIAVVARGSFARLHAIGADDAVAGFFFDEQMFTEEIELVSVEAGLVGAFKAFTHLDVEDAKAQAACCVAVFNRVR